MPWISVDGGRVELTDDEYDRLKYARVWGETPGEAWQRCGQAISWSLSTRPVANATPLTDVEHRWFTDYDLALRREVGPPKERSVAEHLGIAVMCLVGATSCMVTLAFVAYGLYDLARWLVP